MLIDKLSFHTLIEGVHEGWKEIPLHQRVTRAIGIIDCLEKKYGLGPDFDAMLDIVDSAHPLGCLAGKPGYTTTEFEKEKRVKGQPFMANQAIRTNHYLEVSILGDHLNDFILWTRRKIPSCPLEYGSSAFLISIATPEQHLLNIDRLGGQSPGTFNIMHRINTASMYFNTHTFWARGEYIIIPVVSAQKLRMPRRFVETVKHNNQCAPEDRIDIRNDFPLRSKESSPGYLYLAVPFDCYSRDRTVETFSIDGERILTPACDGVLTLFHGDPLVCTYASAINRDKCIRRGSWDVGLKALTPTVQRLVAEFVEVTDGWTARAFSDFPDEREAEMHVASAEKPLQASKRHAEGFFSEKVEKKQRN
ncbi:hypothetical protein CYLTODRAFT_492846 [Cylindrobasidium torrendii FP15055 ss-10]|uniref:Uncharacterized protein n=1 Tax=Cylindrobasidium torrendii FP15055 ss-10 TaxID=1314674 RepID=A0A0D7B3L4_9AGAR|nr:hypothetical protein CYLTODRAFT_492846 [Cylindrobasidium torrendii FP15055 ss-10]